MTNIREKKRLNSELDLLKTAILLVFHNLEETWQLRNAKFPCRKVLRYSVFKVS